MGCTANICRPLKLIKHVPFFGDPKTILCSETHNRDNLLSEFPQHNKGMRTRIATLWTRTHSVILATRLLTYTSDTTQRCGHENTTKFNKMGKVKRLTLGPSLLVLT